MSDTEEVMIPGPVGALEALVERPQGGVLNAAGLVCHPHPLHGGTMHNKVAHTLARSFRRLGIASVRFNFRGVGRSEGTHGEGVGEYDDAIAVAGWMQAQWARLPLVLGGFSFGAMVALRAASGLDLQALITVALPVRRIDAGFQTPECPWLIIHGARDELVDVESVVTWLNSLSPGPELTVMEDADHFFHGKLIELRENIIRFLETQTTLPAEIS